MYSMAFCSVFTLLTRFPLEKTEMVLNSFHFLCQNSLLYTLIPFILQMWILELNCQGLKNMLLIFSDSIYN